MAAKDKLVSFFARAFGADDAQPATAQVQAQMDEVNRRIAQLRGDLDFNTRELADAYGDADATERVTKARSTIQAGSEAAQLVLQDLQRAMIDAQHREALAAFEAVAENEAQAVVKKASLKATLDALYAQIAEVEPLFHEASRDARQAFNNRTYFNTHGAPPTLLSNNAQPDPVRALVTGLERLQIQSRYGLSNTEELEGARRQAAGQVAPPSPRNAPKFIADEAPVTTQPDTPLRRVLDPLDPAYRHDGSDLVISPSTY